MRDASAFLGGWAFAGVPAATLPELAEEYRSVGIDGAALSPVDAVLQPEPMAANRRLLAALRTRVPAGFVATAVPLLNPSLPGWEEHLRACLQADGDLVRAVKIVPGYHAYALDHPAVDNLAESCRAQGLGLCVQVRMEDERMHHPRMPVPPVPPADVVALAGRHPDLRLLVCGGYMAELGAYRASPNVRAELSFVESGLLLRDALQKLPAERLLLGTHAPLHMVAPGAAKGRSDDLDPAVRARIEHANYAEFFAGAEPSAAG